MKNPETPKKKATKTPVDALKDLQNNVRLPAEAAVEQKKTVEVVVEAREARLELLKQMKEQQNVPQGDLEKIEKILTA